MSRCEQDQAAPQFHARKNGHVKRIMYNEEPQGSVPVRVRLRSPTDAPNFCLILGSKQNRLFLR